MTGTLRSLVASLDLDTRGFAQGIQNVDKSLGGIEKTVTTTAKTASTAVDNLSKDFDEASQHANKAADVVDKGFRGKALSAVKQFGTSLMSSFTDIIASNVMATASKFVDDLGNSIELASNKSEQASKVNVLFGNSAHLLEEASRKAAQTVGMSSGKYLESAGNVGNLVRNFGLAGDEAANMSVDILQLAADMGSFNNAEPSEVVLAMGAAFRGENEPIRRFGIMLGQAAIQNEAMKMGLITTGEELDKESRFMATYNLILQQTGNAQGDFARTSMGYANQQRINAAMVEEAWTVVGESIKPVAQVFEKVMAESMVFLLGIISGFLQTLSEWVDANQDLINSVLSVVSLGLDVLIEAVKLVVGAVGGVIQVLLDSQPAMVAVGTILGAILLPRFAAWATMMAVDMIQAVGGFILELLEHLVPGLTVTAAAEGAAVTATWSLNAALAAIGGPITLVVAAVAAVVAVTWDFITASDRGVQAAHDTMKAMEDARGGWKSYADVQADVVTAVEKRTAAEEAEKGNLLRILGYSIPIIGNIKQQADMNEYLAETQNYATEAEKLYQQQLEHDKREAAIKRNQAWVQSLEDVKDAIRGLGPTYTLTQASASRFGEQFGLTADEVRAAWASVRSEFTDNSNKINAALSDLEPGFQMTQQKIDELATEIGVDTSEIELAWTNLQSTMQDSGPAMEAALKKLPDDFRQFAIDAHLSLDQVNGMIESMPPVWGQAAVDMKAAISGLPPELQSVAEQSGMSVEQINQWIASLPPEAWAMQKETAAAFRATTDSITGALDEMVTGSDDAWKAWKRGNKDSVADAEARIEKLQGRLKTLNEVDLTKLGPSALLNWMNAKNATQTELGQLTSFVDNHATIVANVLPEALENSKQDNIDAWNTVFGIAETAASNASDKAPNWGNKVAAAFIQGLTSKLGSSQTIQQVEHNLSKATAAMRGESPPKVGPLHLIDKWGWNVMDAWVMPAVDRLKKGRLDFETILQSYATTTLAAGPGIQVTSSGMVPVTATAASRDDSPGGRKDSSSRRDRPLVGEQNIYVQGMAADEVDQKIYKALHHAEWDLDYE